MSLLDGQPASKTSGNLWGRKWKILVTDKNDQEALNVSNLHCTFEVHQGREKNGFWAQVKIYNLERTTEQALIMEGDRLIIEAGYEASMEQDVTDADGNPVKSEDGTAKKETVYLQYGKIFDGQIVWPARSKEGGVNYCLTLVAVDGLMSLFGNYISKTVNRGLNQRQILETVAKNSEILLPVTKISDGLSPQVLPRGKVFFGSSEKYISDVCRGNAATYYSEGGALNVVRLQDANKDEALVISPENGLIGMPQQTPQGINYKVLLNPSIHLGTMVRLKNTEVNENTAMPGQVQAPLDDEWIYQAINITHRGDTSGQEWYTEVTGISRYGKGTLPAILANSANNGNGV